MSLKVTRTRPVWMLLFILLISKNDERAARSYRTTPTLVQQTQVGPWNSYCQYKRWQAGPRITSTASTMDSRLGQVPVPLLVQWAPGGLKNPYA